MNVIAFPKKSPLDIRLAIQESDVGALPLSEELKSLIERVSEGGQASRFLANAFLSYYRINKPFNHSLAEVKLFDSEVQRLFHFITKIYLLPEWDDMVLYEIEQKIISITREKKQ